MIGIPLAPCRDPQFEFVVEVGVDSILQLNVTDKGNEGQPSLLILDADGKYKSSVQSETQALSRDSCGDLLDTMFVKVEKKSTIRVMIPCIGTTRTMRRLGIMT